MEELWALGLQCSIPWLREALEAARRRYPLSFFIKKDVKEIELLLTVWQADWESRWEHLGENATDSGEGGYRAYVTNLCNHLYHYTIDGFRNQDLAASIECFRCIRETADIGFVTTNYDLLLEWAIAKGLGAEFTLLESADKHRIPIRKLHGSLGWHFVKQRMQGLSVIYELRDADDESDHTTGYIHDVTGLFLEAFVLSPDRARKQYEGTVLQLGEPDSTIIPPTIGKRYNGLFQELLRRAAQDLMESDNLVIGGYSFPEADPIIQQLVLNAIEHRKPRVIVVNPGDGGICSRLQAILPNTALTYLPCRWSEALAKLPRLVESAP